MSLIVVMLSIDATALNIGIPKIAEEFHASLSNMQWVINVFFLLAAMVQIIGGYLGDTYGHKKVFLIAVFLFIFSSLGAGFAIDETMLIGFRALQGASVGIATPLSFILLSEGFPENQQSFARSFVFATMGIALAIGAPLGGLFVHTIGWRWIFFINLPIGFFCYILALIYCPKSKELLKKRFDLKGMVYLTLTLFFIAFALNELQNWGLVSWRFLGFIVLGLIFLCFLYLDQLTKKDAIVDFSIFKKRRFTLNALIRTINQLIFLGILFFLPLYLQNITGESALISGLTMSALTVVMCIVSLFVGKWVDKAGEKQGNIVAMILMIPASILLLFVRSEPNFALLILSLVLFGAAINTLYTTTTTGAYAVATPKNLGIVSGLFLTIAWLACSLGVSMTGTTIAYVSKSSLESSLSQEKITLDATQDEIARRVAKGLAPSSTVTNVEVRQLAKNAFAKSIHVNAIIFLGLSIIGVLLSIALKKENE